MKLYYAVVKIHSVQTESSVLKISLGGQRELKNTNIFAMHATAVVKLVGIGDDKSMCLSICIN